MRQEDDQYGLSQEQEDALHSLAQTDLYAQQSKWSTFRQLRGRRRWSYFAQHFLPGLAAGLAILAVVVSLVVTRMTKPPDPVLSVQGFNMGAYSSQFDQLKKGFLKERKIDDSRLVDMESTLTLSTGGYDDSPKALTRVAAGEINMVVGRSSIFPTMKKRGYVAKLNQGLPSDKVKQLAAKGILVDEHGRKVDNPSQAAGLDLSRSSVWKGTQGLPDDAILGLSNVAGTKDYVIAFIDYLDFN